MESSFVAHFSGVSLFSVPAPVLGGSTPRKLCPSVLHGSWQVQKRRIVPVFQSVTEFGSSRSFSVRMSIEDKTVPVPTDSDAKKEKTVPDNAILVSNDVTLMASQSVALDNGSGSGSGAGNGGGESNGRGRDDNNDESEGGVMQAVQSQKKTNFIQGTISGLLEDMAAKISHDPQFLFKLMVAEAVMVSSRLAAEIKKRGDNIWKEFELVISNVGNGVISQFFLVLVLAPKVASAGPSHIPKGPLTKFIESLPAYFFQPSIPGKAPFTMLQRVGAFVYKACIFGLIGFVSGAGGAALSHLLVNTKRLLSPGYGFTGSLPPIFATGLVYAIFCTLSSTPRYHTVNGIEAVMQSKLGASTGVYFGILLLRWLNNYYGGRQWVDICRWKLNADKTTVTKCQPWPIYPFILHLTCQTSKVDVEPQLQPATSK